MTHLTEEQIERRAERMMNHLDARLMKYAMSQEEYDADVKRLDDWCEEQYAILSAYNHGTNYFLRGDE